MEDSGALPLEMPVTELNMGDMIDVFPYEGVTKRHGTEEVRLLFSLSPCLSVLLFPRSPVRVCVRRRVFSYLCVYPRVCCLCARPPVRVSVRVSVHAMLLPR